MTTGIFCASPWTGGIPHPNPNDASDTLQLHLLLSTDGGNTYRTLSSSYWPLQAVVLDLPPHLRYRYENMILLAIWSGATKPSWNEFLQSSINMENYDEFTFSYSGIVAKAKRLFPLSVQFLIYQPKPALLM